MTVCDEEEVIRLYFRDDVDVGHEGDIHFWTECLTYYGGHRGKIPTILLLILLFGAACFPLFFSLH